MNPIFTRNGIDCNPFQRLTSDEVEAKLADVLLVLKYVQNKDVFMRYHKAHLTRLGFNEILFISNFLISGG